MLASLASSMSESVMTWKVFGRLGSSNTESCACNCSDPASQGWPFSVETIHSWGGASVRPGAFIRGEHLIQTLHLRRAFIRYEAFI